MKIFIHAGSVQSVNEYPLYGCLDYFFRDIYDKMRADLRLSKEEAQRIETSRAPKVFFNLLLTVKKR